MFINQKLLGKLIQNWRDDWDNPRLPFLFVQLPYFGCGGNPDGRDWVILREQQKLVALNTKDTAMAMIPDCGENYSPF